MITRVDADGIAAVWARRESLRRGQECTAAVAEFALGFAVWTRQPDDVLPEPGDGATTVIDRQTGRLSHWPHLPVALVEQLYQAHRPTIVDPPRSVDAEAELRRGVRRRISPAVAAHLTLDGRVFVARGAKSESRLHHHRLVGRWLGRVAPGHLVRGAERHAELLVASDALHEVDRIRAGRGDPPLTLDEARVMFRGARLEAFHIRAAGDLLAGAPAAPCETCVEALVDLALLPWAALAGTVEWRPPGGSNPAPERFPDEVGWVLAAAGWQPWDTDVAASLAEAQLEKAAAVPGREHRHEAFPAAFDACGAFPTMTLARKGPGVVQRIRAVEFAVTASVYTADMLREFGWSIGARLFPLGAENYGETLLAIDELGRVFAFDQGGDWFVGDTLDAAMITLLTGGHTPRVRDDGTW